MSIHLIAVQLLVTALTGGLAVVGWRYRFRPGARPFVALTGAISALSATYLVLLVNPDAPGLLFATVSLRETVFSTIPVLWVVFALDYTGSGRLLTKRTVAGLSAVPLVTAAVLWFPPLRGLYWGPHTIDLGRGLVQIVPPFGPWYWVNLGYGYLLMVVGLLLLLKLLVSDNQLYADQSVAIVLGALVPFVANVLLNLDAIPTALPLQPVSFAVTALAFAFALYRFELFRFLPITRRIGRTAAIGHLQEGVIITDTGGQIVDVNRAGAAIFDRAPAALLGQPLHAVLGEQAPPDPDRIAPTEYRTADGRSYGITVSPIHDRADRLVGRTVVLRDVTDRELRETQLEVFNRVLRHNLRNKLTVVLGYSELLSDRVSDAKAEFVEEQMAATLELMTAGERAREFDTLEARREATPTSIDAAALLREVVDELAAEFPDATATVEAPPELAMETYPDVVTVVLENLLRNAAEHAGDAPRIAVTAAPTDGSVEFVVRDDGPGIPDGELAVLETETETALEHGSGLGLWIAKWGVRYLGGTLEFAVDDGTIATVTVPKTSSGNDDPAVEAPAPG